VLKLNESKKGPRIQGFKWSNNILISNSIVHAHNLHYSLNTFLDPESSLG
jgi:hypothetical protein